MKVQRLQVLEESTTISQVQQTYFLLSKARAYAQDAMISEIKICMNSQAL